MWSKNQSSCCIVGIVVHVNLHLISHKNLILAFAASFTIVKLSLVKCDIKLKNPQYHSLYWVEILEGLLIMLIISAYIKIKDYSIFISPTSIS